MVARGLQLILSATLLLVVACARTAPAPRLSGEYERVGGVLQSTIREMGLQVQRVDDSPSIRCTVWVGWLNTDKYRGVRQAFIEVSSLQEARGLAKRVAARWRAANYEVKVMDQGEGGALIVRAEDGANGKLSFAAYPGARTAHLIGQTACLAP